MLGSVRSLSFNHHPCCAGDTQIAKSKHPISPAPDRPSARFGGVWPGTSGANFTAKATSGDNPLACGSQCPAHRETPISSLPQ